MFSQSYTEALKGVPELDEAATSRLEQHLTRNPADAAARLQMMAYLGRADQAADPRNDAKRFLHTVWLIEHVPGSEILRSPASRFLPGDLPSSDFERSAKLWAAASKAHLQDAAVQWNAASFFEHLDPELRLRYLEATEAADPNHPYALRPLAHLYALSILGSGPMVSRAQAGLDASKNVWVLGNAAYMLQSQSNLAMQRGAPNSLAAQLAEKYFLRAKTLDPKLDRQAILPQLDRARVRQEEERERQEWASSFDRAAGEIQRLPISAFPSLPPAIAGALTTRKCRIPQPADVATPRNVIQGDFRSAGETGWAALCSVGSTTSLLVFRDDRDGKPETIDTCDERTFLQGLGGDKIGYSREITAANRDFIMRHYQAYSGPRPPPIDHLGIDDAFVGKASVTRYFHQGKWLRLQGAD